MIRLGLVGTIRVVGDNASQAKALVETNREGHRSLEERRIVGGMRTTRKSVATGAGS